MTPLIDEDDTHKLNVSSTSVADYFKEKMRLVAAGRAIVRAAEEGEPEARVGIGARRAVLDEPEDGARVGLGGNTLGLGMMARMGMAALEEEPKVEVTEEKSKKHKRKDKRSKVDEDAEVLEESPRKRKKGKRKEGSKTIEGTEDSEKKKKKKRESTEE